MTSNRNEINEKIMEGIKNHLDYAAQQIISHNGWNNVNIPDMSEKSLLRIAEDHGLESDPQTRDFCKFISLGTNFASLDFREKLQTIPSLVKNLKDLITKMQEEITEYAEIASFFQTLIQSFLKVVMNTKHNMKMVLTHLEEACVHLEIMYDALKTQNEPMGLEDCKDVDIAMTDMSKGILKLIEHSKNSKEISVNLDAKINDLTENIGKKITVVENRIGFSNLFPKVGATLGTIAGLSATNVAVESIAFGGVGAIVMGGFSFPPIGAILIGSVIGAFGTGSLFLFIKKLWERRQFKALGYLKEILDKLNQLNSANLAFTGYMNKSEEDANRILSNIDFFKRNVRNGSSRYRKTNAKICRKALGSTNDMIETIHEIVDINLKQWIEESDEPSYEILYPINEIELKEFD